MDHLPQVTEVVGALADDITLGAEHQLWQIDGAATAGKSTVLHGLGERLSRQFTPVRLDPAPGEVDAGPAALLQLAAALKEKGVINGESEHIADPAVSLREKIELARGWIARSCPPVVLLLDEPSRWAPIVQDDAHFAQRTSGVVSGLLGAQCIRVVAGALPGGFGAAKLRDLAPTSAPTAWLKDPTNWGGLADAAREVSRHADKDLAQHSPLHIRFLIALRALGAPPPGGGLSMMTRRALSGTVANALGRVPALAPLRALWTKLALVRRPFGEGLLEALGAGALPELGRDLLRYCLLYRRDGRFVLHETLRQDALDQRWLPEPAIRKAHGDLARIYFEELRTAPAPQLTSLDAYHHATESADDELLGLLTPQFVEQLDARGRARSLRARREAIAETRKGLYLSAAECFRQSLQWEEANAYAHHYLAYNLDVVAVGTAEVEANYRRAIALEPRTPWWHSRWICYLIARGQGRRAEQAWDEALDAIGERSATVVEGLHQWVARLLLHRGQLEFADRVLSNVPAEAMTHPRLRALMRRLDALRATRERRAVLPGALMRPGWWTGRPAMLEMKLEQRKLVKWMAARVDEVDLQEKVLRIDAEEVSVGSGEGPRPISFEVPFTTFDSWRPDEVAKTLASGRFLEIGTYSSGRSPVTRARVFARGRWDDDDLPPIFPDPTRWLAGSSGTGG